MATDLAKLKTKLATSGLSQSNNALYEVVNELINYLQRNIIATQEVAATAGSGGSSSGITSLTTDVVAVGPGAAVATIQPDAVTTAKIINDAVITAKILDGAVTYAKIQNTTLADVLIGRATTPGTVQEIELGANLQIVGDTLEITTSGGGSGGGLEHNLLSATHPDTVPASPIEGDLIYAGPGTEFEGTYVNAVIMNPVVEETPLGIFGALYLGFDGGDLIAPISGAISVPTFTLIPSTVTPAWLTWDILDFLILNPVTDENSIGIWGFLNGLTPGQFPSGPNVNGAITTIPFTIIPTPSPTPSYSTGLWRRTGIGTDGQVLTVVDDIPQWTDLPSIPAEPAYPWVDITFNAANFTATGGATPAWTVAAGDVVRAQYQILPGNVGSNQNVRIAYYIKTSSVSGAGPPTQLQITLPFNIIGAFALFISMRENSLSVTNAALFYDEAVSTNQLFIEKVPSSGTFDTTADQTYLSFEISATLAP